VNNALKFSKHLPHVRFGSTEACLQVMAIPVTMTQEETMAAFVAGWNHHYRGEHTPGYYIGREHPPFTMVRIVKTVDPEKEGYMHPCEPGEPGYLITRGANLMSGYVGQEAAASAVFREGWYTGLRDIGFALPADTGLFDYYWVGRDSAMLIRGGANYAYEQVAADLSRVLVEEFHLAPEQFSLAVVGLKIASEHEDSCCVTIELREEIPDRQEALTRDFLTTAARRAPKGSRPDYVRFGEIPRSFKGAILYPRLKEDYKKHLLLCRT
jgi:acyl-CoA synthetase (AMP-forming)/AMP-acid ligase II